jgi:hypothetical protein
MGGATYIIVGAAAPTKKIKNSDKCQMFTIFAPINYKVLHPQGKRTPLKFVLAPPLTPRVGVLCVDGQQLRGWELHRRLRGRNLVRAHTK